MASTTLEYRQGFVGRPLWVDLQAGGRPPPSTLTEPGEWAHGWQFYASCVSEHHYRKDRSSCPVMSQRPGTPEVPLRWRMLSRAPRVSHES